MLPLFTLTSTRQGCRGSPRPQDLTQEGFRQMIANGLTRSTVQHRLNQYAAAIAAGGKKLANTQLLPRYELMKKILQLWPDR
jgi:hypothetical protein